MADLNRKLLEINTGIVLDEAIVSMIEDRHKNLDANDRTRITDEFDKFVSEKFLLFSVDPVGESINALNTKALGQLTELYSRFAEGQKLPVNQAEISGKYSMTNVIDMGREFVPAQSRMTREREREKQTGRTFLKEQANTVLDEMVDASDLKKTEGNIIKWLNFQRNALRYSANNQLLIMNHAKEHDLTCIMSKMTWEELKGANGESVQVYGDPIQIYFPVKYNKLESTIKNPIGEVREKTNYTTGEVFALDQTNAEKIGVLKKYEYIFKKMPVNEEMIFSIIESVERNFNIKFNVMESDKPIIKSSYKAGKIPEVTLIVHPKVPLEQTLKSILHELGHHLLHGKAVAEGKISYGRMHESDFRREAEAEGFAHAVLNMISIDNKPNLHLGKWNVNSDNVLKTMNNIQQGVHKAKYELDLYRILRLFYNRNEKQKEQAIKANRPQHENLFAYNQGVNSERQMSTTNRI